MHKPDEAIEPIYFITGATGLIGKALCEQLLKEGKKIRALTRNLSKTYRETEIQWVEGEYQRPEVVLLKKI